MKIAIISDIHGHWPGLEIVVQHIQSKDVDRIICLGDLVEGGEDNDFVVEFIKNKNILTVRGNHDENNDCQLQPDNQNWLSNLPETIIENGIMFTHISPRLNKRAIQDNIEAWNVLEEVKFRLVFIGHLHFPAMFGNRYDLFGEACPYNVDYGEIILDPTDRYIISFGAIGYARGGGKFIRYGIYDSVKNSVEFIKLEGELLPYGQ
ncbi:metallophosphoesterase family protein [Anabaena azotica]|uniref:metallophosphoesterase family protein n=1 Tax=Anabaena azotica TaxID=197653 RepID=UPI0039A57E2F